MNADGSNQQNIGAGSNPSWSADGSKLVIVGSDALYVLNADGSNYIPLVSSQHPSTDFDLEPVWSPDGSSICFTRSVNCDGYGDCESTTMWTINPDGTNLRNISNMADQGHAWSPDGTKIVFASQGDGALDLFVINKDGTGVTDITNSGDLAESQPSWQPLVSPVPPVNNPIDDAQFFVHQQYADFLNREPDSDGQTFWTNQIIACSGDPQCTEVQRINDSAAFYLSIEFQQTGYLVYRTYKAAYGNLPNAPVPLGFGDFVADTKQIGQGVEVLQPGWDTTLENNKQAFAADFVQRTRFASAFPDALTPDQFVDTLNLNAGNPLSQTERDQLVSDLNSGAKTRANVLRAVAEHPNLVQAEFNRAFVLMQYFGYLRRDPNAGPDTDFTGYNFWLDKLNTFNGDFAQAEMVKAFIESDEYRQRFLK